VDAELLACGGTAQVVAGAFGAADFGAGLGVVLGFAEPPESLGFAEPPEPPEPPDSPDLLSAAGLFAEPPESDEPEPEAESAPELEAEPESDVDDDEEPDPPASTRDFESLRLSVR
jgi:hypothetical protein